MKSEYETILTEVFCDVLMKYAFMFGDALPKDEFPPGDGDYMQAAITFSGHRSGALEISAPVDACVELAANVLGKDLDDDDSMDDAPDALKELINIVCGQFLTAAFGEGPVFDLLPPSISTMDETDWENLVDNEKTVGFMVEDAPAIVKIYVDQETESTTPPTERG